MDPLQSLASLTEITPRTRARRHAPRVTEVLYLVRFPAVRAPRAFLSVFVVFLLVSPAVLSSQVLILASGRHGSASFMRVRPRVACVGV